jgi:hypothetical protein
MTHAVKQKLERFRRDPSVETEIGALKQLTEAEALWLSPVLSDWAEAFDHRKLRE